MANFTKQEILDAIRQTTNQNNSNPLGKARFRAETGIGDYDWGRYWARFSDAQKEAGVTPNQPFTAYDDEYLVKKMINKIRKFGKYPTLGELRVELNKEPDFPFKAIQKRKKEFAKKILDYCDNKSEYNDVTVICNPIVEKLDKQEQGEDPAGAGKIYEVYLFKSGRYYKIGKTNDSVRRGKELRIQLPEATTLIHSIKTDDPSGVELYWDNRFKKKRKLGEWFDLTGADVKAFKRWKRIV